MPFVRRTAEHCWDRTCVALPTGESREDLVRELCHMIQDAGHGVLDLGTRELIPDSGPADRFERVARALAALQAALIANPELRIGQAIANATLRSSAASVPMPALFYIEDEDLIEALTPPAG